MRRRVLANKDRLVRTRRQVEKAIVLRQIVISRRGRWEVDDQAFIRRSLEQLLDAKGVEVALRNFPSGPVGGFDLCERHR